MAKVFVDCMACKARLRYPEHEPAPDDAQFIAWAAEQGWTVAPTRCSAHAGEEGTEAIVAGYASKAACALTHDPAPWVSSRGIAMAQTTFGGGDGHQRLSLRDGYCQEESHYWLYDHHTVPALAAEVAAGAEPKAPR